MNVSRREREKDEKQERIMRREREEREQKGDDGGQLQHSKTSRDNVKERRETHAPADCELFSFFLWAT